MDRSSPKNKQFDSEDSIQFKKKHAYTHQATPMQCNTHYIGGLT